jgi:hypothetical protein
MPTQKPWHLFERARVLVSRYGVNAGEEGEVTRVLGDGSIEITVTNAPSALDRARLGSLANHPTFAHRRAANFAPEELKRPYER